jgi:hypothetical protein
MGENTQLAFSQEPKPAAAPQPAKFDEIKIADALRPEAPQSEKAIREKKRVKDDMLRGGTSFNERDVSDYYMGFVIPRMTLTATPELCNESRKEILEDLLVAERSEAIMKPFNEWLFRALGRVATGNYQPAAGINAVSILGRLNDTKPTSSGGAPKPMAAATRPLLMLAVGGKSDGIRAAAFEGLERHIRLGQAGWNDAQKETVADELIKSLSASQPIQRNNRAHAWLLGRSLDLLTLLKHKRQEQVYLYALERVADKSTDPLLLEKALRVIGSFPAKEAKPEVSQVATTNTLKYLVKSAKTWQDSVVNQAASSSLDGGESSEMAMADLGPVGNDGGGGEGEGGMATPPKKPPKPPNPYLSQPNDVKTKRREMHQLLETVRIGLDGIPYGPVVSAPPTGLVAVTPEGPNKTTLSEVLRAIESMQVTLNDAEIQTRPTLGTKTTTAYETLIASAERYQGVSDKPIDTSAEIALPPEVPDPNGDFGVLDNGVAPVNPTAAAPIVPAGDGFND